VSGGVSSQGSRENACAVAGVTVESVNRISCCMKLFLGMLVLSTLPHVQSFTTKHRIEITPAEMLRGTLIFGAGDLCAQAIERSGDAFVDQVPVNSSPIDVGRLVKTLVIGLLHGGLFLPYVYQLAEVWFPGRTAKNVALKTLVSCCFCSAFGNCESADLEPTTSTHS
jgi:hypothetical protein